MNLNLHLTVISQNMSLTYLYFISVALSSVIIKYANDKNDINVASTKKWSQKNGSYSWLLDAIEWFAYFFKRKLKK